MNRYSLRSTGTRISHDMQPSTNQRRANSESSLPTLSPIPDLSLESLEIEAPRLNGTQTLTSPAVASLGKLSVEAHSEERDGHVESEVATGMLGGLNNEFPYNNEWIPPIKLKTSSRPVPVTVQSETDPDDGAWTTVTRKRTRGAKSTKGQKFPRKSHDDYTHAFRAAEKRLTEDERSRIRQRGPVEATAQNNTDSDGTHGEGPSQGKGKGADPTNWGSLGLDNNKLDIDAQWAMLDNWNTQRAQKEMDSSDSASTDSDESLSKYPEKKPTKADRRRKARAEKCQKEKERKVKAKRTSQNNPIANMIDDMLNAKKGKQRQSVTHVIEPAQQIVPKSYLG
ncbi:hypothetical protein V8E55_006354 [Tylopilus felleus]